MYIKEFHVPKVFMYREAMYLLITHCGGMLASNRLLGCFFYTLPT